MEVYFAIDQVDENGRKEKALLQNHRNREASKRDGRFVESVGYYDPCRNPAEVKINRERVNYWIERGAQPIETVRSLIKRKAEASAPTAEANG